MKWERHHYISALRKIVIAALFIIGVVELLFPLRVALMFYMFSPRTLRIFAAPEQQQLFQQLHASIYAKEQIVVYLGIATIIVGVVLLITEKWSKPNA